MLQRKSVAASEPFITPVVLLFDYVTLENASQAEQEYQGGIQTYKPTETIANDNAKQTAPLATPKQVGSFGFLNENQKQASFTFEYQAYR